MQNHIITPARLEDATRILAAGGVIAFPTETVYGVMADAASEDAIVRLYALKVREKNKPCQVLVKDITAAGTLAEFSPAARELAEKHWPGALTLVLPRRAGAALADAISPGAATVGIRCPDHPLTRQLLESFGRPIAASSANPAGLSPATTAAEAVAYFPALPVLDGGTTVGQPSTVVDCTGPVMHVLRQGTVIL